MALYRRKPVTVNAFKLPPALTLRSIKSSFPDWLLDQRVVTVDRSGVVFDSHHGNTFAAWGAWVVEHADRSIDVMDQDEFEEAYQPSPVREAA